MVQSIDLDYCLLACKYFFCLKWCDKAKYSLKIWVVTQLLRIYFQVVVILLKSDVCWCHGGGPWLQHQKQIRHVWQRRAAQTQPSRVQVEGNTGSWEYLQKWNPLLCVKAGCQCNIWYIYSETQKYCSNMQTYIFFILRKIHPKISWLSKSNKIVLEIIVNF